MQNQRDKSALEYAMYAAAIVNGAEQLLASLGFPDAVIRTVVYALSAILAVRRRVGKWATRHHTIVVATLLSLRLAISPSPPPSPTVLRPRPVF